MNSQTAQDTNETNKQTNNPMKANPRSARATNETIKLKRILREREILTKQYDKKEFSECRDTNETMQRKRILRVHEVQTKQSNEKEFSECRDSNETMQ